MFYVQFALGDSMKQRVSSLIVVVGLALGGIFISALAVRTAMAVSVLINGDFSSVATGWSNSTANIILHADCNAGYCFQAARFRRIDQVLTLPAGGGALYRTGWVRATGTNTGANPCIIFTISGIDSKLCAPHATVGVHNLAGCYNVLEGTTSVTVSLANSSVQAFGTSYIDNVAVFFYAGQSCASQPWLTPTPAATATPYLGSVTCLYTVDVGGGATETITIAASILHNTDFETVSTNPIFGTAAEQWHRNADGARPPVTQNYTTPLGLKPHALGEEGSWAYDAFLNGYNQYCQTANIPDGLDHFRFYALLQPQPYICDGDCLPYRFWEFGAVSGEGTYVYTMTQGDAVQQISGTVDIVGVGGSFVFCYSSYGDLDGYLDQLELVPYSSSDDSAILCIGPTQPVSETNPFPTPAGGPTPISTFAFPTAIATPTPGTIGVFPTIAPGIGLTPQATACVGWNSFTLDVPFSGSFPFDVPTGTVDGVQLCLEPIIVQADLPAPIPDSVSDSFSTFITLSFSAIIVSLVIGIVRSR